MMMTSAMLCRGDTPALQVSSISISYCVFKFIQYFIITNYNYNYFNYFIKKLQIANGPEDSTKDKAMVKH